LHNDFSIRSLHIEHLL